MNHTLHLWELKRQEWYAQLRNLIQTVIFHSAFYLSTKLRNLDATKLKQDKRTNSTGYPIKLQYAYITTMVLALSVGIGFSADEWFLMESQTDTSGITNSPSTTSTASTIQMSAQPNTSNTSSSKWVINLSSGPLTKAQKTLLAKGPNFVIVPKLSQREAYITAVEEACIRLPTKEARGIRGRNQLGIKEELPCPNPISARR